MGVIRVLHVQCATPILEVAGTEVMPWFWTWH